MIVAEHAMLSHTRPYSTKSRSSPVVVRAVAAENKHQELYLRMRKSSVAATAGVLLASQLGGMPAFAELSGNGLEPSPLNLVLKERAQEIILESKANHDFDDLSHQDLTGAIFGEADLKQANLEGSDLRAAVFSRSVMYKANLSSCDMTDAMLDYVVLRGANMRGSILTNANLIRSDLGEIDATDADFTDAIIDKYQLKSICATASGKNPATGVDTRESLRCEDVTFYTGFNSGGVIQVKDAAKKN